MAALMSEALTTSKDLVHLSKRYTSLLWARCIGQEADTIRARVNIDETDESPSTEAQDCGRTSIIITPLRKRILFVASAIVGAITLFYTAWAYAHVIEFFVFNGLPWEEKVKKGWTKALHFGSG